jgi:ATP adenylyltransferase
VARAGTLWTRVGETVRHALTTGALRPIDTEEHFVDDGGVRFVVRQVSSLGRKDRHAPPPLGAGYGLGPCANPFLPYDADLFVAELSPSHVCLLNKFNVVDHHLLIVTRAFEDQEMLLTEADFAALWQCLREVPGLGFYNGGTDAGASQPHKHLQMLPLPLASRGPSVPIEPLTAAVDGRHTPTRLPGIPFRHAFARFEPALGDSGLRPAAARAAVLYRALLDAVGIGAVRPGDDRQSAPYNLLLTRGWMLVVRRVREHFDGISVNALGFAGSLFVRDRDQMRRILENGPMAVLRAVAAD